ncbi:MAG: lactamase [Dehalococcoidales bacterium]|nr:lactamase [Dehalococcoidales bacterium]
MDIRILGAHNCETLTSRCVCFLIDDTLAIDAGSLTSSLSVQEQRRLNAVVITHQHFDHIRDIPGIALNLFRCGASIQIYSTATVCDIIETNLLNGKIYPRFHKIPETKPTVHFNTIKPLEPQEVDGHNILAVPVNHFGATVGYQISDNQGRTIFYTGDTGPGLSDCWRHISPQLLMIEVTLPDECELFARETSHLTPHMLEQELISFRELKGYLPQVIAVHMDISLEPETKEEISAVARRLDIPITVAHEGMRLKI